MRQHLRIHKAEPNKGILDYSHLLDAPAGKLGCGDKKRTSVFRRWKKSPFSWL